MELLEKYVKEIEQDLKIDEFNIKDSSLKAPGRKHYWVSRLIHHKRNLIKLETERNKLSKKLVKELSVQTPVKLSTATLAATVAESETIKNFTTQIEEEKLLIEFLEKTEKTFSSLTYDIKNIVEIMKLEQL